LPGGDAAGAEEIVDGFGLRERGEACTRGPYVMLNMVSTVDGRATIGGRSRALGSPADRDLFHALRGVVDAVMAGAGTVRVERYGRLIPDPIRRRRRLERGLSEEPLACIVSRRLSLPGDIPLLADPAARVVMVTSSEDSLPHRGAQIDYIRSRRDGRLDLRAALAELHDRLGVRTLLCEGGPHLNAELLAAGLVDELFLTLSAKLAGGEHTAGEGLRILAGPEFAQPLEVELRGVLHSESNLFLRYGVGAPAPERVS